MPEAQADDFRKTVEMCRLYGFRADEETKVEWSLVHAQNSLMRQNEQNLVRQSHVHGWGIATYQDHYPRIERQAWAAYHGEHFRESAERIYSRTVIAHILSQRFGRCCSRADRARSRLPTSRVFLTGSSRSCWRRSWSLRFMDSSHGAPGGTRRGATSMAISAKPAALGLRGFRATVANPQNSDRRYRARGRLSRSDSRI